MLARRGLGTEEGRMVLRFGFGKSVDGWLVIDGASSQFQVIMDPG